jgi:hypothetical protein
MATHLRDTTTIEDIADICDAITGSLETDPKTKHLSSTWATFTELADQQAREQKQLNRRLRRARTNIEVQDAIWDPEVAGSFGRAVLDATGGKRDIPPYTRFFKELPPSEVRKLKPEDEVKFGNQTMTELNREPKDPLAITWLPRIAAVHEPLAAAIDNKTQEEEKQITLYHSRDLLLREVNKNLDIVEGKLQEIFPGDPKRVASYLSATKTTTYPSPEKAKATPKADPETK